MIFSFILLFKKSCTPNKKGSLNYHHHIRFPCLHVLESSCERLSSISVFSYVLADFPFFEIIPDNLNPCFPCFPVTLKVLHLLDQALSSILSRKPNHCSLLSCKHPLMLFNFSLVLSSSAEIFSSGLKLQLP